VGKIVTDVVIIGAGPAGAMLSLCLVRMGYNITLIERTSDFQREFRGETISPDMIMILEKMGILDDLKKYGFLTTESLEVYDNKRKIFSIDFVEADYEHKYPIDIPQPIVLNAILAKLSDSPNFKFITSTICRSLIKDGDRFVGCQCSKGGVDFEVNAKLLVAADGRYSKLRDLAGIQYVKEKLRRDALWFKIDRPRGWKKVMKIALSGNQQLTALQTYPDMLRIGLTIPSNGYKEFRKKGLEYFYSLVESLEPSIIDNVRKSITSYEAITLLDIFTTKVRQWYKPGIATVGDSAHTLSPILGLGVNQAVQDSIVLANKINEYWVLHPGEVIPDFVLKSYQDERQPEVDFVSKFQRKQEFMLSCNNKLMFWYRRMFYAVLNNITFISKKMFIKLYFPVQSGAARLFINDLLIRK
jgi:2-polyprenyl-6-methoxyphenol hydroxylase-like FAD-dependent oxidoreductase